MMVAKRLRELTWELEKFDEEVFLKDAYFVPKKLVKKEKKREWSAEYVPSYVQSFSMDFCDMLNDSVYNFALNLYEKAEMYLNLMWQPTAPDNTIMDYAIAKHGTLNFLMATHAMLPSENCFRPWEIKTLMNLPYNWIGNMPPQADVREVVKFIANFHLLFTRNFDPEGLDPNERKALENQNQNFMDILERICPSPEDSAKKGSAEKTDEASYEASEDLFLGAYCVPLTWEDQYAATNVAINYAPQGHEFVYKPPRPVRGVATPRKDFHVLQEGYAHTSAYPDTEVHLQPDFIVSAKSAIARGPYHRHTRAKLRTLA
uniref:Uncharacterized protein n=2 Tax=Schistocephalus solidus TaxID=70667 RepID=A0A0X3Q3C8_SCHSO